MVERGRRRENAPFGMEFSWREKAVHGREGLSKLKRDLVNVVKEKPRFIIRGEYIAYRKRKGLDKMQVLGTARRSTIIAPRQIRRHLLLLKKKGGGGARAMGEDKKPWWRRRGDVGGKKVPFKGKRGSALLTHTWRLRCSRQGEKGEELTQTL